MFNMIKKIGAVSGDAGFTLVEMLVTVTIIGVLAAVVTVGVSGASSTAQTQANKQLFNSVQTGIDAYAASTPSATGVPTSGSPAASASGYYGVDGTTPVAIAGTELFITFTSPTNNFKTFFRLANTDPVTFKCVVQNATTFTLYACHN